MEFQSIEEYYTFIENDTDLQNINLSVNIRELLNKYKDEKDKIICTNEIILNDLMIEGGIHIPISQSGDNSYLTLKCFNDNFDYIKKRASNVQNPKYKAKYNHILWLSSYKHISFAKIAINCYMNFLEKNISLNNDYKQKHFFTKQFKNLFILCQTTNYKKKEVLNYFISILESDCLNDFNKYSIIKFIIEKDRNIEVPILQIFLEYSKKVNLILTSRNLENNLKLLIILCQKLKISPNEFHEKLGEYHLGQIELENTNGLINYHYYNNALEQYKKANNKIKIEEISVLLEREKKNLDLKEITISSDEDKEYQNILNQMTEIFKLEITYLIKKGSSIDILKFMILEDLIPEIEKLNQEKKPTILDLVTTITFDINKNITKNTRLFNPYSIQLNLQHLPKISFLFSEGFKSGKITSEIIIDYLKNYSWFNNDFTYLDSKNKKQGFNWLELITPSIQSFFVQYEIELKTKKNNPQGYILSIDSLVIKFEGLLREFSRMIGAQTLEVKNNFTEERISIEKLLENEKLKALLPVNDNAFIKYLFTPDGSNLRNNIAHSFFKTDNYNKEIMFLLIIALLRLGNYKN